MKKNKDVINEKSINDINYELLKKQGVNVEYKTKLNSPELSTMISDILK
jgi:restriction endonuclease